MTARIDTTHKLKIQTNVRYEMEAVHLMDTEADEEDAFCKARVSGHDLTGVDDYLDRRGNNLPVRPSASLARLSRASGAAHRLLKLEAGARELRASAEASGDGGE